MKALQNMAHIPLEERTIHPNDGGGFREDEEVCEGAERDSWQ